MKDSTAVVHTLGILMEGDYKKHVRSGNITGLFGELLKTARGGEREENPFKRGMQSPEDHNGNKATFERMNRDSGEYHRHTIACMGIGCLSVTISSGRGSNTLSNTPVFKSGDCVCTINQAIRVHFCRVYLFTHSLTKIR